MQYAMLIYTAPDVYEGLDEDERQGISREYLSLRDDARTVSGAALEAVQFATTVRERDGRPLVSDGPFAETKEVFAGLYVIDAADLDDAIEFASQIPAVRLGGSVEIRPVAAPGRDRASVS